MSERVFIEVLVFVNDTKMTLIPPLVNITTLLNYKSKIVILSSIIDSSGSFIRPEIDFALIFA
jgi:hypothetical protein